MSGKGSRFRRPLSLRARFVLLIVGSAVIPPVVFALVGLIVSATSVAPDGISSLNAMRYVMRGARSGATTRLGCRTPLTVP